jgi:hypothetical protein
MPNLKQMVKRTDIEIAKAKRTCRFTGDNIAKGSICLVIYDGPRDRSCYSQRIGLEMIKAARVRLDALEATLSGSSAMFELSPD